MPTRMDWRVRRTMGSSGLSGVGVGRGLRAVMGVLVAAVCLVSSEAAVASSWSVRRAPSPRTEGGAELLGVSCTSMRACTAVGDDSSRDGTTKLLIDRWNGSRWSIQPAPSPFYSVLASVSCTSSTVCTAVGAAGRNSVGLVERWNGRRWSIQPVPSGWSGPDSVGEGAVDCASSRACVAVQGSAVSWKRGARWSIQPSSSDDSLEGVSCRSASFCEAVGGRSAARWDGLTWRPQRIPTIRGIGSDVSAVSCGSASSCIAIGNSGNCDGCTEEIIGDRWNGSRWSLQQPLYPPAAVDAELFGVSCPAATACIAVGSEDLFNNAGDGVLLAERWNGTHWSIALRLNPARATHEASCRNTYACATLNDVSCPTATFCMAVGSFDIAHATIPIATRYSDRPR